MWRALRAVLLSTFMLLTTSAGTAEAGAGAPIVLWPGGAPGAVGSAPEDIPTLTPYLPPKEKATGAAIVVCPGGGYEHLAEHEGRPVAEWLNTLGVAAFVLKYRLGPRYQHPAMLRTRRARCAPCGRAPPSGALTVRA